MPLLTIMQGLPGSGKSTVAQKTFTIHQKINPGKMVRINRDLLRSMMHFGSYSSDLEKDIVIAEMTLAELFMLAGKSVIVDDTNMSEKTAELWRDFAIEKGFNFKFKEMYTPLETCIERDKKREYPVGEAVIRNMAKKSGWAMYGDNI